MLEWNVNIKRESREEILFLRPKTSRFKKIQDVVQCVYGFTYNEGWKIYEIHDTILLW